MEREQAREYIEEVRDYRRDLAKPLHDSNSLPAQRANVIGDLRAFWELNHEDPDYRQALRVISELRSQREINQPSIEKCEFPQDPEERFKLIISSIGNNAGKQITFLSIPSVPNTIITPYELHHAFLKNSQFVWKTGSTVQQDHAERSLIPLGMVAEKSVIRSASDEIVVGFTQTEAGKEYGDPICRFLLKYASEHNVSLEKILGVTVSSTDSRAPHVRSRILEYLEQQSENPDIKIVDLENELGIGEGNDNFKNLQDSGLLIFDSVYPEKSQGKFNYFISHEFNGEVRTYPNSVRSMVLEVIDTLQNSGIASFDTDIVFSKLSEANPTISRKSVQQAIIYLCYSKKYLTPGEFVGGKKQSSVTILQEGIEFVRDVITPIKLALTDTPEGKELRQEWKKIPWTEYAPHALSIHKDNSRNANHFDQTTLLEKVKDIVIANPGLRSGEIQFILKEQELPYSNVSKLLKNLSDNNILRNERVKKASKWFVVDN